MDLKNNFIKKISENALDRVIFIEYHDLIMTSYVLPVQVRKISVRISKRQKTLNWWWQIPQGSTEQPIFEKSMEMRRGLIQENTLNSMPFLTIRQYEIKEEKILN